ncbi:MAG: acetate--CoA ligase family protein [Gammaproteobacteria bacterium]|nr:acetate--CoA ligase family protein [Gammaproteobacteria bacterium]
MSDSLQRLLRPRSIAVFGGSWAQSVVEQCQKLGYDGDLWPVNPNKSHVAGLPCYSSVEELPGVPDASFIGVNRDATIGVVRQLAELKAGGATCFASGFSEAEREDSTSIDKQHQLLAASRDMPIIGPNCYGLINYLDGVSLWPDQHGGIRVDTGVAILTQSSNLAISLTMQRRGLPIAYVLTAGNQAQLSLSDLAAAVIQDSRVTALGMHIEGIKDPRSFETLGALSAQLGKPIVALKVGSSEQAQHAMVSHTKSLSGSDSAATAFLERCGITRVFALNVFVETLKVLHVSGAPYGKRVFSMSCSGGEAAIMSDTGERYGINFPPLNDRQQSELRNVLGPMVALANPLDYHTYVWNNASAMEAMFRAMFVGESDSAILIIDFPRGDRCTFESWHVAVNALLSAKQAWPGVLAVVATLSENIPEDIIHFLHANGVVALQGLEAACDALATAAHWRELSKERPQLPIWIPIELNEVSTAVPLDEAKAKSELLKWGINVPNGIVLETQPKSSAELESLLRSCNPSLSFPIVLKGLGWTHKTENNGVILDIHSIDELQTALFNMHPPAGYWLEDQIAECPIELLVGIVRDPVLGFQLTIGMGGILAELVQDTCHWLMPVSFHQIQQELLQQRMGRLLEGYRGQPGIHWKALESCIEALHKLVENRRDALLELEINPLLCTTESCIAVDCLIREQ